MSPGRSTIIALLLLGSLAPPVSLAGSPAGFVLDPVPHAQAWDLPTAIAFAPDGRLFVAEKAGRVWVVEHGVRRTVPVWDGTDVVLANGDRGLTGLAVDPNFLVNHRIYLALTVDPNIDGVDDEAYAFGQIVRYTMDAVDTNVVDPASRLVLIGSDWSDGVLNAGAVHTIDGLRWGEDGSLLASMGDGALYLNYDRGGITPELFAPGRGDTLEDLGQFRSQSLNSYGGKLLRLDPETGLGLPSNPFWNGDSTARRSRVWAYGFRNPWRFAVRPGTGASDPALGNPGQILVGDVGLNTWESVVAVGQGGLNAGWPCWDGVDSVAITRQSPPRRCPCDEIGDENPLPRTPPVAWFHHTNPQLSEPPVAIANSLTMGVFYTGTRYPAVWRDRLFLGDFAQQWIRVAALDSTGRMLSLDPFIDSAAAPVDFASDPVTGDLYYVAITQNEVRRIRYVDPGNHAPVAALAVDTLVGSIPMTVHASAAGSTDPDGDSLAVRWDFGDGEGSTGSWVAHTYARAGVFPLILTLEDARGAVSRETTVVAVFDVPTFPTTPSLDAFLEPEPEFDQEWQTSPSGIVLREGRLEAGQPGAWALRDSLLASGLQEAHARLFSLPTTGAIGLLLKAQGTDPAEGAIRVLFERADSLARVQTIVPGNGWVTRATLAAPGLEAGVTIGARALPSGEVQLFENGSEIGRVSAGPWPWHAKGGRVGLAFEGTPDDTTGVDEFGGGNAVLEHNGAPSLVVTAPADSGFYAAGDSVMLAATVGDDRDPADSLRVTWTVDLRHNNHVHPAILQRTGTQAAFVAESHEDGTGTNLHIRVAVSDLGGMTTLGERILYPDVDLVPLWLSHAPDTLDDLHAVSWTAAFANRGRMPSAWSRWRLVGRTANGACTQLAQGDIRPAAAETTIVTFATGPIEPPGDAEFRLVVDSLAAVIETDESNNALMLEEHVVAIVNAAPEPQRFTALGPPRPNPWRTSVSFALTLADAPPGGTAVRMRIYDVAGRQVARRDYGRMGIGERTLAWDGRDEAGRGLQAGLYFARIEAGRRTFSARIVRLP